MKIVCFHLLNDYSGSPKILSQIVSGLLEKGYAVDLITSKGKGGALDSLKGTNGFKQYSYHYRFSEKCPWRTCLNYVFSQISIFFFSLRYMFDSDAIFYINTILPIGGGMGGRLLGKKVVYHYHENAYIKSSQYRYLARTMERISDRIICVSSYQASFLSCREKLTVIHNALHPDFIAKLKPDAEHSYYVKNILLLSSLKDYKGIPQFIQMAHEMPQFGFTLVINDTSESIDKYLFEQKVNAKIIKNLSIFSRQSDVSQFYNNASLVVNLTDKNQAVETFGLTALEAMTAGLPVIVPTIGGIAEMVEDGINGYKIDVQNLMEIENTIQMVLSDKNLYLSLSKHALESSKKYSIEQMVNAVEAVLMSKELPLT